MMSPSWNRPTRLLRKTDAAVVVAISLVGHGALAYQVSRPRTSEAPIVVRPVSIELVPPPVVPPVVPPPPLLPKPERKPTPHKVARPTPVQPRPEPERPNVAPADEEPREEPGPVPEGDDPNSGPGGNGQGLPGPALPPAPPPAPPPPPAPVVAAHEGANYLKNPRPAYPEIALRRGWQGEVLLKVRVSPDGKAASIVVQRTSGRELLDQAAIEAVKGWSFVPARQGGLPIGGWVTVPIVFKLQGGE